MTRFRSFLYIIVTCFLCLSLSACSRITQENFDKINTSMTMKDVVTILGEPTHSESVSIAGISGTAATWKDNNAEINIQFLNDRVTVKTFSNLSDEKSSETRN